MNPQDRVNAARKELNDVRKELSDILKKEKSRRRGPVIRLMHEVAGMMTPAFPYASQSGQDQVVDTVFKGKRDGTFLDIGAFNGITGSNSLYFEKWRGWTGTMVEPVQAHRETAQMWRSAACLPYAISDQNGEASFIAVTKGYTQMSGLEDSYDSAILKRVRSDPRHAEDRLTVPTRTLNALFDELGITEVDFVSLDIEGGELSALRAFDFAKYRVGAWAIENNTGTPDMAALMREHGYNLAEFCGVDEIYVRNDLLT
ncbi:FkbM family methyltransferase [Loktanella sp. SALINAS62]|uniref:FkbM family methyltransferase n=1 Tax=Loktanella sp. SALINAS62 TaxID=2706124 RepID=UPI001B8AEA78|nr:FkbM family methyltransferase [Loktanella sp. SALINAS62]MBS1301867.1 FkbM family methyltransferase [Loktanella sp. SALINAS62]